MADDPIFLTVDSEDRLKALQATMDRTYVGEGGIDVARSPDGRTVTFTLRRGRGSSSSEASDATFKGQITVSDSGDAIYSVRRLKLDDDGTLVIDGADTTVYLVKETYGATQIPPGVIIDVTLMAGGDDPPLNGIFTFTGSLLVKLIGKVAMGSHPNTGWEYTGRTIQGGDNAVDITPIYNGMEHCDGTPWGKLGILVNSDGTVGDTDCVIRPMGVGEGDEGAVVPISWDPVNQWWMFAIANSSEPE